jgi:hypothetical protein
MHVHWDDGDGSLRSASFALSGSGRFHLTVEAAPETTAWEWLVWCHEPTDGRRRGVAAARPTDSAVGGWSEGASAAKAAAEAALDGLLERAQAIAA